MYNLSACCSLPFALQGASSGRVCTSAAPLDHSACFSVYNSGAYCLVPFPNPFAQKTFQRNSFPWKIIFFIGGENLWRFFSFFFFYEAKSNILSEYCDLWRCDFLHTWYRIRENTDEESAKQCELGRKITMRLRETKWRTLFSHAADARTKGSILRGQLAFRNITRNNRNVLC